MAPHHIFASAPHFRPYRWASPDFQVGLQPIAARDWLILDDDYAEFMRAKRQHLTACAHRCYRTLPGSLAAQRELRSMVLSYLLEHYPNRFTLTGDTLSCAIDGHSLNLAEDAAEPLRQLSAFVQEDFMLLQEVDGRQQITAASNAYSSSGRLVASVGHDVRWAHENVPDLTKQHGSRIDRILSTMHQDFLCARFNWLLTPLTSLFFPEDPHVANAAALQSVSAQLAQHPSLAGSLLHMRVERQTLRRLPKTGAVAFSIHTYSDPLSALTKDDADISTLINLLKAYSPARLQYSEMGVIRDAVVAWLEALSVA
jgi:hypothetical protein